MSSLLAADVITIHPGDYYVKAKADLFWDFIRFTIISLIEILILDMRKPKKRPCWVAQGRNPAMKDWFAH